MSSNSSTHEENNVDVNVAPNISAVFYYDALPYPRINFRVNLFQHNIHTTVTSSPGMIEWWLQRILNSSRNRFRTLVVGMGVQWTRRPPTYRKQAATLQLCVGTHCLIIQFIYLNHAPNLLRNFLIDPRHIFVGVWNSNDWPLLWETNHHLVVHRVVDLRQVAVEKGRCSSTLITTQRLVEEVLGFQFHHENEVRPPLVGKSNWDAFRLSLEQVQYACVYASVSFLMGKELRVWN